MFSINNLDEAKQLLSRLNSNETEYVSKTRMEYKKSSNNDCDFALILCDTGEWITSRHLNNELDTGAFLNISAIRNEISKKLE